MCTYGKYVYIWKICVHMENMCTYGKYVYIWKICVHMENMCTYGKYVYIWKICVNMDVEEFKKINLLPTKKRFENKPDLCYCPEKRRQ